MKGYTLILAAALSLLFPGYITGMQKDKDRDTEYLGSIGITDPVMSKDGRDVSLSMGILLDSTRIKTQHTVRITPVYISGDGARECEFGSIIIDGNTRSKAFMRKERFEGRDSVRSRAQAIIRRKNGKPQEYAYLSVIPYSRWMLGGRIEIREDIRGCTECSQGKSERPLLEGITEFIPRYVLDTISPAPEPVKHREESRSARLAFMHDRYDIIPSLQNNKAELDSVRNSINLVRGRDYITITGIYVTGYASPEGRYEYNMQLSRNRAESFARYISAREDIDKSLMHTGWGGEDWEQFSELVGASGLPQRDSITSIISQYTEDRNLCEQKVLALLSKDEYEWVRENIYPLLRHCLYRITYDVRNFNLEEARQIIYTNPEDLSLSEIYQVAGSYSTDSDEYRHAMAAAEELYPDSPAVLNYLAVQAINEGNATEAVTILQGRIPAGNAIMLNTLGVAYALTGEYTEAARTLNEAIAAGSGSARQNLGQLQAVTDQL